MSSATGSTGAKKLLVFSKGDSYGQGLRDQLVDKLTFAGKKLTSLDIFDERNGVVSR